MDFSSPRPLVFLLQCFSIVVGLPLLLGSCAQFYGKYARRGTNVVVKAEAANVSIEYQIFVLPTPDAVIEVTGFQASQPILKTDDQPFMFSVGRYVIRYRCGPRYLDTQVHFRRSDAPQIFPLSCVQT